MTREIHVHGATLQRAFSEAALRVFALTRDPSVVQALEVREVRAHGLGLEELLARWIDECCYIREIEGFVCHAIDFAVFDVKSRAGGEPLRLHAFLRGEEVAADLHPDSPEKVTPCHDRPIRSAAHGYEIHLKVEG